MGKEADSTKTDFEARIAQFAARDADQTKANGALEQTVTLLSQQNQILEQRLNDLSATQRLPTQTIPTSSESPGSNSSAKAPSGDVTELVAGLVRDAVNSAIKPLVDRQAADTAQAKLQSVQSASWTAAFKQYPQLQDADGVLTQAANRIWETRPDLQSLDDGPLVVASLAASALAGSKEQKVQTNQAKRQAATVPGPTSARDQITGILNDNASDTGKLREAADAVTEQNQVQGVRGGEEGTMRSMNVFRAQLSQKAADILDAAE